MQMEASSRVSNAMISGVFLVGLVLTGNSEANDGIKLRLEVEVDAVQARQLELDEMGVGRTIEIRLDPADRLADPIPVTATECAIDVGLLRFPWQGFASSRSMSLEA